MKENSIEEDIKILEEFIKYYEAEATLRKFRGTLSIRVDEDDIDALENLINMYKKVLKEVKRFENMYEAEKRIHIVRNEQLDRKQKAIIKCNELENENKELKKENEKLVIKLEKENTELKEYISIAPNLDEMTAVKYRNIQQDAYIKGRAEEQQRAEQIIYENYIPIQKVKDKIRKNEEIIDISNDGDLIHELLQKNKVYEELLESEE